MGIELRPGSRFRSAVCDTEVVVVKAPSDEVDLRCGGEPVLAADQEPSSADAVSPDHAGGSLIGKRYTDGDELEILCSKSGDGSLSIGATPLEIKGAKPLPSSD